LEATAPAVSLFVEPLFMSFVAPHHQAATVANERPLRRNGPAFWYAVDSIHIFIHLELEASESVWDFGARLSPGHGKLEINSWLPTSEWPREVAS
jgi:hypothetical protein